MARRVLVTGAGGFIGRALVPVLATGWTVREASRRPRPGAVPLGPFDGATDWREALEGCEAVVHLAARVHIAGQVATHDPSAFAVTNRDATLRLAAEAARHGVQRLVFVSTVKVNGEGRDTPYRESDPPEPEGPYAVSKHEAELGLHEIAGRTGLKIVILRPPLVYGPGVGGNFRVLLKLVARGIPLPLAAVRNRRSLVGVGNFASAIALAIEHPAAVGRTYLVSDQHDLSTPELISAIAAALGARPRLFPVPPLLLGAGSAILGRQQAFRQIAGSLKVDSSAISRELGWRPVATVAAELEATARWFRDSRTMRP